MIYLIDRRNRDRFDEQLEDVYRIRHRVYVEKRGWKALARFDKREIDQFDNEDAVYLLQLRDDGSVTAGVRLISTTKPHLMRDIFPHIVTLGRIPNDERVFEMTRYFVSDEIRDKAAINSVAGEVLCGMFEFGISRGLTNISVVCDTFFLPMILSLGPNARPLGLPTPYAEGTCIATIFPVTREALQSTREGRGISEPVLAFSPTPPPYAEPELQVAA